MWLRNTPHSAYNNIIFYEIIDWQKENRTQDFAVCVSYAPFSNNGNIVHWCVSLLAYE